jgi:hypothetical protein
MAATAVIAAVAIATTAYTTHESRVARRDANDRVKDQEAKQQGLLDEAKAKDVSDAKAAEALEERTRARSKQRAIAASAQGRQGTLLTGPSGLDTPAPGQPQGGKTLLGS